MWLVAFFSSLPFLLSSFPPFVYFLFLAQTQVIKDVFDVVVPDNCNLNDPEYKGAHSLGPCVDTGDFVVLYDEAEEANRALRAAEEKASRANRGGLSRASTKMWK